MVRNIFKREFLLYANQAKEQAEKSKITKREERFIRRQISNFCKGAYNASKKGKRDFYLVYNKEKYDPRVYESLCERMKEMGYKVETYSYRTILIREQMLSITISWYEEED